MKWICTFNQALFEEHFPYPTLDVKDAVIFDFISQFMLSKGIEVLQDTFGTWYWVSYTKVAKDLPYLGLKTGDAIYRRINKLIDVELLEAHPENKFKQKTYYRPGEHFDLMFFKPSDGNPNTRTDNRSTFGNSSEAPSDDHPTYNSIIDTTINDTKYQSITFSSRLAGVKFDQAKKVALHLLRKIVQTNPEHRYAKTPPAIDGWVKQIELAMRKEERSMEALIGIINYMHDRNTERALFWVPNIESGQTLRLKFDKLKQQFKEEHEQLRKNGPSKNLAQQANHHVERLNFED